MMNDLLSRLGPDAPPADRYHACHNAEQQISKLPVSCLPQLYSSTQDLMQDDASVDARRAGFAVLSGLLSHPETTVNAKTDYLKALLIRVDPRGTEQQFKALRTALARPSGLTPMAEEVADHVLSRIIPQFEAQNAARKRARSENRAGNLKETPAEERGMHQILEFLVESVTCQPNLFSESRLIQLFELILTVAEKASATGTVERVCLVIKSVIIVSRIPSKVLRRCLEDLCAIYNTTQRLKDITWECLELLLISEHQNEDEIVDIVLETIGLPPQERQSHTVCGAIRTARFLMTSQSKPHIPKLDFSRFLDALARVNFGSRRIRRELLRTVGLFLADSSTSLLAIDTHDWSPLIFIIQRAIDDKRAAMRLRQSIDTVGSDEPDPFDANDAVTKGAANEEILADQVAHIANAFAQLWPKCTSDQRKLVRDFFGDIERMLPEDFLVQLVLTLSQAGHYGRTEPHRQKHLDELVELFSTRPDAPRHLRVATVGILKSCHIEGTSEADRACLHHLTLSILTSFETNKDLQVANALADLIVTQCQPPNGTEKQLKESLELIWPLLSVSDSPEESNGDIRGGRITNSVATSLVELFICSMGSNPPIATLVYHQLVSISNARHLPLSAQLAAVKLLTRLRCDLRQHIQVITSPDIQGLAETLCRTEQTTNNRFSIAAGRQQTPMAEEKHDGRSNRVSTVSGKTLSTLRSNPRSSTRVDPVTNSKPPLWLHPGQATLPIETSSTPSDCLRVYAAGRPKEATIHIGDWLVNTISIIQQPEIDWEIFSYVIAYLPAQLSNRELFGSSFPHIRMLRRILVDQLLTGNVYEPPRETGVRKGDVALCLYHALIMLVGYSDQAEREEQERIIQAFVGGVTEWERTAGFCIQSLTICSLVLPTAVTNWLTAILQRMSQMITQAHLSMDILEFLANLARHRKLYVNFREEEYRTVFAICIRYLEHSREQRLRLLTPGDRASSAATVQIPLETEKRSGEKTGLSEDLSQYVFALAYHVLTVWFLAVKIGDRNDHVGWITSNLAWKDASGSEIMEEQSQVTLDMMMRTAYLNLGETAAPEPFTAEDGRILSKTWLLGLSIVTIETAAATGVSRVTKRQASGTTFAMYRPKTIDLPPHHEAPPEEERGSDMGVNIFPNHVLLQLTSSIAPTPSPMEAICLPDEDPVRRALSTFDRNDTVDGYKVGVIYVGNDQTREVPILANDRGSAAFESFLDGLGMKVRLQGATFNTQGLDKVSDLDGTHTVAWRDRVTEIIFHIPTMMPTDLENDAFCINKKKHIGNDYVKIIWNESGHPFQFDTFTSQFNCVNIVIVPDAMLVARPNSSDAQFEEAFGPGKEPYYTIQVITAPEFPSLSPVASYKLLPLWALPMLTRQLSLQASVFSNVWINRDTGEHASSWRNRLREIKRLRERYANTGTSTSEKYPGAKSRTNFQTGDEFRGRVVMGGLAELGEDLIASLDFSRWAGPNAYN